MKGQAVNTTGHDLLTPWVTVTLGGEVLIRT